MNKAKKISQTTRRDIAKYKRDHPKATMEQIAQHFNVTSRQVQYALDLDERGELSRRKTKTVDARQLQSALTKPLPQLVEEQSHYTMAQLSAIADIDPLMRSRTIERVARARQVNLHADMQLNLHGVDWRILCSTIRRFWPEATDIDCIRIFNEERDRCSHNTPE